MFRRVHAECFGVLDRYYTPFVAPPHAGSTFGGRAAREVDPERNRGLDVIPQLLTKDADEFVYAAGLLADMGYREVNLNLGCPSGTVFNKGKGSGFLRDPEALDAFLGEACARSPLPVSVKTRLGVSDDAEFGRILDAYCATRSPSSSFTRACARTSTRARRAGSPMARPLPGRPSQWPTTGTSLRRRTWRRCSLHIRRRGM